MAATCENQILFTKLEAIKTRYRVILSLCISLVKAYSISFASSSMTIFHYTKTMSEYTFNTASFRLHHRVVIEYINEIINL